jgi:hypothetical protein
VCIDGYFSSKLDFHNYPNAAAELRISGVLQSYSIAKDELVKVVAAQYTSAQEAADAIAAAWEKIADQISCESQIGLANTSVVRTQLSVVCNSALGGCAPTCLPSHIIFLSVVYFLLMVFIFLSQLILMLRRSSSDGLKP